MHRPSYACCRNAVRFVGGLSVRHVVVHGERLRRPGPFLVACTHIGHLEPMLVSCAMSRPVHWVARIEFFRIRPIARLISRLGAIPVNRRGVPVRMIREAVRRLSAGEIVGIFPEGGRTHGDAQVVRGGPIKGGVCAIALRAGVPVVPVVVLGLERMHEFSAWLPGERSTVRTIVGEPILPGPAGTLGERRSRRRGMTAELRQAFITLTSELNLMTGGPA